MKQKYNYQALTASGDKISDSLFASDPDEARNKLLEQSLVPISIEVESSTGNWLANKKASLSDIEQSTSQLATLLQNGLRINSALEVLVDTATSPAMATIWQSVYDSVQSGHSLHESLSLHPELFDSLYLEMANIAENTGTLPSVFKSLSENLAFQRDLKMKTIQALIYPGIIFFVCVTAIFSIFNFVIPNMESVFASNDNLPSYTQWLLDTSEFVSNNNAPILFAAIATAILAISIWNNHEYRKKAFLILAKVPIARTLIRKSEQLRFTSAMTLTLESGLSLSDAFALSIRTLSDPKTQQQLHQAKVQVDTGKSLSESLLASRFIDKLSLSLIRVGEESGTLPHSFSEITKRARTEFESWMVKLTSLLEPLLIIIMGAVVGGVVVVMLLSIVSVNDLSL